MLRVISSLHLKRTLLTSASFAAAFALIACGGSGGGTVPTTGTTDGTTSGGGTLVTLTSDENVVVAFQNGKGAWTPLKKGATGYSAKVTDPSGLYGFAVVNGNVLRIIQSTIAEDKTIALNAEPTFQKASISFTTLGVPAGIQSAIFGSKYPVYTLGSVSFRYNLDVNPTWDAVGRVYSDPANCKFILKRNQSSSGDALTFDFDGPEAIGVKAYTYPGGPEILGLVVTSNGTIFDVPKESSSTSAKLYFPTSLDSSDRLLAVRSRTSTLPDSTIFTTRTVATMPTPESPGELPMLPELSGVSAEAVDTAHGVYQFHFETPIEANFYRLSLSGSMTTQVYLTRGWLDGGSTYATPDLSSIPAFASLIGPKTSAEIQAMVGHPSLSSFIAGSDYHRLPDLPTISFGPGVVEASSTATKLPIR